MRTFVASCLVGGVSACSLYAAYPFWQAATLYLLIAAGALMFWLDGYRHGGG